MWPCPCRPGTVTLRTAQGRTVVAGDHGAKVSLIARGRVGVLNLPPGGARLAVKLREDGDNFGELGLLRDPPRSARPCRASA